MKKAIKSLFVSLCMFLVVSDSLAAETKNKSEIKTVDNYVAIFDFEVIDKDKEISRPGRYRARSSIYKLTLALKEVGHIGHSCRTRITSRADWYRGSVKYVTRTTWG